MLRKRGRFSLVRAASILRVSRSGYDSLKKVRHKSSHRDVKQQLGDELVLEAFRLSKSRAGARRIQKDLEDTAASKPHEATESGSQSCL